jgi:hypothetical protein
MDGFLQNVNRNLKTESCTKRVLSPAFAHCKSGLLSLLRNGGMRPRPSTMPKVTLISR